MFECHHNLEYAYGQSDNLKYALKYPFKGPSFSYIKCQDGTVSIDEPAQYARMLYRSPPEAHCRIYSQRYAYLSHTVIPLSIHLPGEQNIYFKDAEKLNNAANGILPETHLTQYWKMWKNNEIDKNILYENMPETYSWNDHDKIWKPRIFSTRKKNIENRKITIGRIYTVSPREPERFALYVLMRHFPGDPDHLRNINGTFCDTFADAARMRGLFEDNSVWEKTLKEASNSLLPSQMRSLFVNILIHGSTQNCVIDSLSLWEMFKEHMIDKRNCTDAVKQRRIDRALAIIERYLFANGKQMKDYRLPLPSNSLTDDPNKAVDEFFFPQHLNDDDVDETVDTSFEKAKLNHEQENFYKLVLDAVMDPNSKNRLFFLSGDGGTGKTFLLNFLLFNLRRLGNKVLPTASTGIASTKFYAGGMTLHSAFRLGINNEPDRIPSIPVQSYFWSPYN
uniref:ATP-dependent DNA helicase n=1 Tax=Meloidogyne enterolobii TaxID=390850 RepID=A0A6V7X1S6_MELEN|nr:unnamed protein product [Meloidogyne enterolobii]